jgi:hypothetical protein
MEVIVYCAGAEIFQEKVPMTIREILVFPLGHTRICLWRARNCQIRRKENLRPDLVQQQG